MLPDPPDDLPAAPRAFSAALRDGGAPAADEVDFGDSGIGVTFADGVGAQVSRRAAVTFAGNEAMHFDDGTPGWEAAAAAWVLARLQVPSSDSARSIGGSGSTAVSPTGGGVEGVE